MKSDDGLDTDVHMVFKFW